MAITLIFADYVYNLQCIMCLGGEKNQQQNPTKSTNQKPSQQKTKQSWKLQVNALGVDIK